MPALDVLRFVLAAAVMFYHLGYSGPNGGMVVAVHQEHLSAWSAIARYAVHAFFMISGFVIVFSTRNRTPMGFLSARIVRLWPSTALCATLTLGLVSLLNYGAAAGHGYAPTFASWTDSVFLLPLADPTAQYVDWSYWSLTVELRYYLIVFLLLLFTDVSRRALILSGGWIAIGFLAQATPGENFLETLSLDHYSGCFAAGMLAYVICQRKSGAGIAWLLLPFSLALTSLQMIAEAETITDAWKHVPAFDVTAWILAPAGWFMLYACANFRFTGQRPRFTKWATRLGAMSFPLYLLHQFIGYAVIHWSQAQLGIGGFAIPFLIALLVILALSAVSALIWEPAARPLVRTVLARLEAVATDRVRQIGAWAASLGRRVAAR